MLKHWPTILYSDIRDESNQQPKDMISDPLCVSALGKKGLATGTVEATEALQGGGQQGTKENVSSHHHALFVFSNTKLKTTSNTLYTLVLDKGWGGLKYPKSYRKSLKTPVSKFASKIMVLGKGNNQFAVTRKKRAVTTPDTPIHVQLLLGQPSTQRASWRRGF